MGKGGKEKGKRGQGRRGRGGEEIIALPRPLAGFKGAASRRGGGRGREGRGR